MMRVLGGVAMAGHGVTLIGYGITGRDHKDSLAKIRKHDQKLAKLKHEKQDRKERLERQVSSLKNRYKMSARLLDFYQEIRRMNNINMRV